ncbi:hypothetical protein MHU86_25618 [Fragilaria crotonensis]|nr:hypothetical protein MHU86_25618 [Fragilaria crotonensis]
MLQQQQEQQLLLRGGCVSEIPSLMDWRKALFFQNFQAGPYDVLVIDVSAIVGNDLEWTTFALIQEFMGLNEAFGGSCHTVLVKSAGLNRLASCLVHGQVWIDRGPSRSAGPHILATVGVQEYRRTMERAVQPGDAVLEVGCHFGTTSVLLHEQANSEMGGYCIGIDVGSGIIERAKNLHHGLFFHVGDAWKTAELLRIQESYLESHPESNRRRGFDVVYVDGGLSGEDGVLEAIMLSTPRTCAGTTMSRHQEQMHATVIVDDDPVLAKSRAPSTIANEKKKTKTTCIEP